MEILISILHFLSFVLMFGYGLPLILEILSSDKTLSKTNLIGTAIGLSGVITIFLYF